MRKPRIYTALVAGLALVLPAAAAFAGPWDGAGKGKASKKGDRAPVQVTVTGGKGRLGVSVLEMSPELRAHFGAPRDRGVLINTIRADSPAARAGIAVGDIVTEVDGDPVGGAGDILAAMSDRKKGEAISIALRRSGKPMTLKATMEDDPGSFDVNIPDGAFGQLDRGFQLGAPGSDPALRRDLERAQKRIQELEKRLDRLERR
ncbi:MAG TPA: PDZ domain-containing protein [Kofleriaceae bacterium]|nr:PDZ domain-containing protein [Kofleriaceae bacterium]